MKLSNRVRGPNARRKSREGALHEPYDALLVNEQVTYPGFMASTHVKILEVFPFHEPSFRSRPPPRPRSDGLASRTRTTRNTRTNWFMVPMHAKKRKGALRGRQPAQ